ncbi:hypothetical protein VTN02DRAFT_6581 [Thermoascus thermophilus]
MDLQGIPIGGSVHGAKAKTADTYNRPIHEGAGFVANDSLAAESVRQGGGFSENRDSQPLGVPGDKSTFANTQTSGATTLPKAPDAHCRDDPDTQSKYPEGVGGQGQFPGRHLPTGGYAGGPTATKREMGIGTHGYQASRFEAAGGPGVQKPEYEDCPYYGGPAPNYITPVLRNGRDEKPNGTNIREGGFDSNDNNNASFRSEIGSQKDPGRVAENTYQRSMARSGLDAAVPGPRQTGVEHETHKGLERASQPYAALQRDENLA